MFSAFMVQEDVNKEQNRPMWASASGLQSFQTCFVAGERQFLLYVQGGEQWWLLPVTRTMEEEKELTADKMGPFSLSHYSRSHKEISGVGFC